MLCDIIRSDKAEGEHLHEYNRVRIFKDSEIS